MLAVCFLFVTATSCFWGKCIASGCMVLCVSVNKLHKGLQKEMSRLQHASNGHRNQAVASCSQLMFPSMFVSLSVCCRQFGSEYSSSEYLNY